MIAVALILLVLVAVLVIGIVVSNPAVYELSIFGAVPQVNSAGVFLTGAITMAVTILALLLLRTGIRRSRARRKEIKALQASSDQVVPSQSAVPAEGGTTVEAAGTSTTTASGTTEPSTTESTTAAERQTMLDEADKLTRDEPQK